MKIKVTLIRHAKTQGNLKGAYIGETDEPLCDLGIKELAKSIEAACYPNADYVYSSKLKRCIQTANMLYPKAEVRIKSGLEECSFGDFEGKNYQELKNEPLYQLFIDSGGKSPFPRGESRAVFSNRCQVAFLEIVEQHQAEDELTVICHGGTIMAILEKFSSPHQDFYTWQLKNTQGYFFLFDTERNEAFDITILKGGLE